MSAAVAPSRRERLAPETLYDLVFVSHPSLDPGGERLAYVLADVERRGGDDPPRYRHRIRTIDLATGEDRPFTQGHADRSPLWSADGATLGFLAPRRDDDADEPAPQLHTIRARGGEAVARTRFATAVLAHVALPGGGWLVTTRAERRDEAGRGGRGRTITRRMHRRDGSGFVDETPVEAWLVPDDGDPRRLWRFDEEPGALAVTPDGRGVVYAAAADADEADVGLARLWLRPLRRGAPRDLLGRPGRFEDPAVSPDGRRVAYFEHADPASFGSPVTLWTVPLDPSGDAPPSPTPWTRDLEARPSTAGDARLGTLPLRPRWGDDGASITVAVNRAGRAALALVHEDGRTDDLHAGDQVVTGFDARGGVRVAVVETPTRTGQLHLVAPEGERRLTSWNDDVLGRHALGRFAGERRLTTADGQELAYWRLEPPRPRRDRALVLEVHGGPHTNYGYGFVFEFHLLASHGYTVVFGNPRGGSSFGHAFGTAITGAYGTVDADDVLATLDHALARHDDPGAPVHLTGGSYGGWMTNWLVGHTERFRSAVTQRSICNWLSFYGTSDIGPFFTEAELAADPWSDAERLWDMSPLKYAANVTTPTLVLHSEADHRCPMEQAEQWFAALKRFGRAPTRLVRFPDEGHELSRSGRPDRRVQRLAAILGWFGEHA